jgi:hypothetical protein
MMHRILIDCVEQDIRIDDFHAEPLPGPSRGKSLPQRELAKDFFVFKFS